MTSFSVSRRAAAMLFMTLMACQSGGHSGSAGALADSASIYRDIAWLSSDQLEGRATGAAGNDSAARFIAARFQKLGLKPLICDSTAAKKILIGTYIGPAHGTTKDAPPRVAGNSCTGTYRQLFNTQSIAAAHAGITTQLATSNVVAMLPGSDPTLRDQYVVLGAHYDHLGRVGFGVLDVDSASAIHNGADDNASGTAAVLELARLLARRPPARSVIFVTFSGEELGLLGSQYFVDHSPVPLEKITAMVNFDMVGRLRNGKLIIYGVTTADEMARILDSANVEPKLTVSAIGDGFGSSDHSSFFAKGIPVLHFFTDIHPQYHRSTDDVGLIDAGGEARVVSMASRVVRRIADGPPLTFRRASSPVARTSTCKNNVALGSIPNMGAEDADGLPLSGVREGSAADKGGLKGGDVVVEFGGKKIKDIYDYQDALCSHQPGDTVQIIIKRNAELLTLSVTLGKRGT